MSEHIDELVKSGDYASESEVVRAGLNSLLDRHEAVERWHEEAAAAYHAQHREPEQIAPVKEPYDHHDEWGEWKKSA